MSDNISGMQLGGLTAGAVSYALDGLSLRHAAIASNIANANSPGYQTREVSFEKYLADALDGLASSGPARTFNAPTSPTVEISSMSGISGGMGSVEMQTVLLSQNVLQYHALIAGLGKYMSTISIAVSEGRK